MKTTLKRMGVPFAVLAVACCIALVFAVQQVRRDPPVDAKVAAPAVQRPMSGARDQSAVAAGAAQAAVDALAAGRAGSPEPSDRGDGVPTFDVARIEPTGEAVVAGRAAPGATVELLRNGEPHDRAVADQSGQFVMVPPRLPPGAYELTLRSKQKDGKQTPSKQSVAVALEPGPNDGAVVALMTPDKPTVVLSQPAASKPIAGTVVVETVEIEPGGKLHVSGQARPGAAVRLYLNDSFVAAVVAGADGRLAFTINQGVVPGDFRVRLDEVEPNSGVVLARGEVPFNVPDTVVTASVRAQRATPSRPPDGAAAQRSRLATAGETVVPDGATSSAVTVPKIATTTVTRGDSLWRISRSAYGAGTRYAIIYRANREQIRNPNLIRPGQVFVLPTR